MTPASTPQHAELIVYAATAAGVCAAVAAARRDVDVLVLEPGTHVGGMVSGGLGYTDADDRRVVGGMAQEFATAVAGHYGTDSWHWRGPEPRVAEAILLQWLEQARVRVEFGRRLESIEMSGATVAVITTTTGEEFRAGVVIDASYEGDVLAGAGIPYAVGREGRTRYGESLAGRVEVAPGRHNFPPFLSPFADGSEEPLPLIHRRSLAEVGEGDGGVMSYGYRVCLTRAEERRPITARESYDPDEWELARRFFRWVGANVTEPRVTDYLWLKETLPGRKCDANSMGPVSLNLLDGSNWSYPDGDYHERERIRQRHLGYTQDFLYFLGNDESVPPPIRREVAEWGFPVDEFTDTAGLPHQLYVREARRMIGEYVLTQHDLLPTATPHYDTIALGSYNIDIREVQRTWRYIPEFELRPSLFNEGYLSFPVPPYNIPYRSIVPRYSDCTNLLVPVCMSASHVAFSSVRMEVQYEMLGHAAGLAASMALAHGCAVQQVPSIDLQHALRNEGQVLHV